jgi:hypothetical protein
MPLSRNSGVASCCNFYLSPVSLPRDKKFNKKSAPALPMIPALAAS